MKLDNRIRYLQIAFNDDLRMVQQILPRIEPSDRIFIEAGTPFVKREGMRGIALMRSIWSGTIVADIKGHLIEIFSGIEIPRNRKFYKKDKDGYYYIPEIIKNITVKAKG